MSRTAVAVLAGAVLLGVGAHAQKPDYAGRDWPHHQGDSHGTRYSTLTQINIETVGKLRRAWTFKTGAGRFASAPMVVDSVMYFSAPNGVYALDAVTGKQMWKYSPTEQAAGGAAAGTALRGPEYWPGDGAVGPRIYSTTSLGLAAIDAKTGTLVRTFGDNGVLPGIQPTSPPAIYKNVLITQGGPEPGKGQTVKGWNVITGRPLWTFYLKAQPGDPNRATWLNGSAEADVSPDIWGLFTLDEERGTVFMPVEKVGPDFWGGASPGNNLYSDSLVALDAATGKMKWFRQLVHHDIWDYDLAGAPTLIDVRRNGRVLPAVVQMTKMGLMFIFNRETGEPIFGVEERPVPQTTAPGEWTSPTQPFPVKPAALARNSLTRAELAKVTPEHAAFCQGLWDRYKLKDSVPYQPWEVGQDIVVFPGMQGGGNWQGAAFNPALGLIITNVSAAGQWGHLEPSTGGREGRGRNGGAAADGPAVGGQVVLPP